MLITEVGEITGLASSALRFYERRGLITPTGRSGGQRVYDDTVIERIALIDIYQRAGFTVAEIASLFAAPGRETWRAMATAKLAELEETIALASEAKGIVEHALRCPNPALGGCASFGKAVRAHAEHLKSLTRPPRPVVAAARPGGRGGTRHRQN